MSEFLTAASYLLLDPEEAREREIWGKVEAFFASFGLSPISRRIVCAYAAQSVSDPDLAHVSAWLLSKLNRRRRLAPGLSEHQARCPDLVPDLLARPFWSSEAFPFVRDLELLAPEIRRELLSLRAKRGFQPYRSVASEAEERAADGIGAEATDRGEWNVYYLFLHGLDSLFEPNRQATPVTTRAIEAIPTQYRHAFFSSLAPRTHIKTHNGPTNKKLRLQLPLVLPEGACRLRVGDEVVVLEEGKAILFDDSFEHEAWNDSDESRIILIMDIWHPDLTKKEVKFFGYLQNASMKAALKARAALEDMDKENREAAADEDFADFFSVITRAAAIEANPDAIWKGT